ncbi:hypothetical protein AAH991_17900 [Microbispora sp. ZYX-F-249]|uniref:Uncharacterized protein n=1 Tax=Microbispora maris TaxID=3144104 RepID=A0ABV0AQV7_9ACTN
MPRRSIRPVRRSPGWAGNSCARSVLPLPSATIMAHRRRNSAEPGAGP